MGKYVIKRLIHGAFSIVIVIAIVMLLVYGIMDRTLIFATDPQYTKQTNNTRVTYMYQRWEEYGYLDYMSFADYMLMLRQSGEIDEETRAAAVSIGRAGDGSDDSELTAEYVKKFYAYCEENNYEVQRLAAIVSRNRLAQGGAQALFAYKDYSIPKRLWNYFTSILFVDNIHRVPDDVDIGERGLTFTLHDPLYGGEKFSPAIIGNGTLHKYLLYFDDQFPYIHQNFLNIHLGVSFSVSRGIDVFTSMTQSQGAWVQSLITYPAGLTEMSADNLHTATYIQGSRDSSVMYQQRFTDDYTNVDAIHNNMSRMGYSFVIGIIATIFVYILGLPLGVDLIIFGSELGYLGGRSSRIA